MNDALRAAATPQRTLAEVFVPGANRFEALRHVFASMVLFDHVFVLSGHGHALRDTPVRFSFGHLGVACFFIVSGALVSASHEHCRSTREFLRNRALRIFPAYWVCLLVSALLIGPLNALITGDADASALTTYFAGTPGPLGYVLRNALLMQWQQGIGALFAANPEPHAINGSLWSIPWEAACYGLVTALGALGGLARRRHWVLVGLALALANVWLAPPGSVAGLYYTSEAVVLLPVYFLLGMAAYLYRTRLPRPRYAEWSASAGFLACALIDLGLAAPFLAYAVMLFAGRERPAAHRPATDASYGIYIYGFPVQQTLVALGVHRLGVLALLCSSAALTLVLALLSWRLVESPALRLKRRSLTTGGRA